MNVDEIARLEAITSRLIRLERVQQLRARKKVLLALAAIEVARDGSGRFAPPAANLSPDDMQRAYATRRVVRAGLMRGLSPAERDRLINKTGKGRYQ